MGRINKTTFILNYLSSKSLRRKIQKSLNNGEDLNPCFPGTTNLRSLHVYK